MVVKEILFLGFSLPSTLDGLCNGTFAYQMENLEIENAMLKNELNVMHREVTDLLERLRKTEDGEDLVVSNNAGILRCYLMHGVYSKFKAYLTHHILKSIEQ